MSNEVRFEEDYRYSPRSFSKDNSGGLANFTVIISGGILNSNKKIIYFWIFISFIFFFITYSVVRNTTESSNFVSRDVIRELSPPEYYLLNTK